MIHKKFVPEGKTVIIEFYRQVLERSMKPISRMRPQLLVCSSCMMMRLLNLPCW
jgi:hypothetical protein